MFLANNNFKICLFMPLPDSSISRRPSIFTFINVLSNSYTHLSVRPVWMSLDSRSSVCLSFYGLRYTASLPISFIWIYSILIYIYSYQIHSIPHSFNVSLFLFLFLSIEYCRCFRSSVCLFKLSATLPPFIIHSFIYILSLENPPHHSLHQCISFLFLFLFLSIEY